jgi:hypothetical protein
VGYDREAQPVAPEAHDPFSREISERRRESEEKQCLSRRQLPTRSWRRSGAETSPRSANCSSATVRLLSVSPKGSGTHARAVKRRAAECLLGRGADLNWVPDYAGGTPLDAATGQDTQRKNVIGWLRERGARSEQDGA